MTQSDGPERLLPPELTVDERRLLNRGLFAWMGGSYLTDVLAVAMGFESAADFDVQANRIAAAVKLGEPLSDWDWTRTLFATEIAFASDVVGLGIEWEIVTPLGDHETLDVLRGLQRKLVHDRPILAFGPRGERGSASLSPYLRWE